METISRFALAFLLNSLWQAAALVLVAAACSRLLINAPARLRNLLWATTLALCLSLPLLSAAGLGASEVSRALSKAAGAQSASPAAPSAWLEDVLRGGRSGIAPAPSLISIAAIAYFLFLLYSSIRLWRAWRRTIEISSR